MSDELEFTGERFLPGTPGEIWIEHWHRYHFAARWAAGKRVLDVACGEGYGTSLLARTAAHVTGVDISPEAIAHAHRAYAGTPNAEFVESSCTRLPLPDASIDLAVSFETLEHIAEQEEFLDELVRVLAPGGLLILSSPNKAEYSDRTGFRNEYHVKELYREELDRLLSARFPALAWFGQRASFYSLLAPDDREPAAGQLVEVSEAQASTPGSRLSCPMYFVVLASRDASAISSLPAAVSVLVDRDDWVQRDYRKVSADIESAVERLKFVTRLVEERDLRVASLEAEVREVRLAHVREAEARQRDVAELRATIEALRADLAAREATISDQRGEIDRRGGLRWWLRLPLRRLGILE